MSGPAIRWWPLVGLSAVFLLGLVVGRRSTPLDDWFSTTGELHPDLGYLLFFTDPPVIAALLAVALLTALWRRRWRLAVAVVATPAVALVLMRVLKRVFGRTKGDDPETLAYPSGHVTVTVAVLGMVVIVVGARLWAVVAASVAAVLAAAGQSFTYHYFTDTIGALLLATSVVCVAAMAVGLDRCQPGCDVRHSTV